MKQGEAPIASEAVRRIDVLFEIERTVNGQSAERRKTVRQELSTPFVADLETRMGAQRAKLSRNNGVAKAMDYMPKRWSAPTRFLDDRRVCQSNNAAGVRGIRIGSQVVAVLRLGSRRRACRADVQLIVTAKMNEVDPQAWLADVLAHIAEHPSIPPQRLDQALLWNSKPTAAALA